MPQHLHARLGHVKYEATQENLPHKGRVGIAEVMGDNLLNCSYSKTFEF